MFGKRRELINSIILICAIYMSAFMIVSPTKSIKAGIDAVNMCGTIVIPSLFPFIFCGNLFIILGAASMMSRALSRIMYPIFGINGAGSLAVVLGLVSGYPIGAVCASSLYKSGECSKTEAERLLSFCNNSGPMFIIGAVGIGMFQNYKLGIYLYTIHIISSLLTGIFFKSYGKTIRTIALPPSNDKNNIKTAVPDIGAALSKSVDTILKICGFIIIFAVLVSVVPDNEFKKYIYAFIEITGGVREIASTLTPLKLPLVSAFIAFSGISVLAQVAAIVIPSGLSLKPYILGKLFQALLAFILTVFTYNLLPQYEPAFAYGNTPILAIPTPQQLIYTSLLSIIFSVFAILFIILIAKIKEKLFHL